jgi:hypothetical protein
MAITTYSELQTAISDFLNRDDLASVVPTFISLAEAGFNRDLRHWRSQRRVSTICDEQYEDLPNDFISAKFLAIDTANGTKTLELASQAEISRRNLQNMNATGEPVVYTINSGEIEFVPAPDDAYPLTMVYYASLPPLSDTDTTNWVLELYPDLYLYGALLHSAPYLADDARVQVWASLYQSALDSVNRESNKAMYSGSPLVMRNK